MTGALRRLAGLVVVGSFLAAGGCTIVSDETVFSLRQVALKSSEDANRDKPVPVDLLIIYDAGMINAVASLTAADWFRRKSQFEKDFPKGFKVLGWEMVPDNTIAATDLAEADLENADGEPARAAFVFALYGTPGEHRARLETQGGLRVDLGRDTFTLEGFAVEN